MKLSRVDGSTAPLSLEERDRVAHITRRYGELIDRVVLYPDRGATVWLIGGEPVSFTANGAFRARGALSWRTRGLLALARLRDAFRGTRGAR